MTFVRQQTEAQDHTSQVMLCDGYALTWDQNQWIINRIVRRGVLSGTGTQDEVRLKPFKFIGSNQRVLRRVLNEMDVTITAEAEAVLEGWPFKFLDFIKGR